ncbi:MAG: PDZ domain-containing protein [Gemmatimonadetes bacterium]|nr:PDZ domain-containing protein [Gemmatimonadota bacterium]MYI07028.1 PDZ domain-containing protein [Gemmatimonadota bacterium]
MECHSLKSTATGARLTRRARFPTLAAAVLLLAPAAPLGAQELVVPRSPDATGFHGLTWSPGNMAMTATRSGERVSVSPVELIVVGVRPCSPSHLAGLEPGDRMVGVDGRDFDKLGPPFAELKPGLTYEVAVVRDDKRIELTITLSEIPENPRPSVTTRPIGTPEKWKCPQSSP